MAGSINSNSKHNNFFFLISSNVWVEVYSSQLLIIATTYVCCVADCDSECDVQANLIYIYIAVFVCGYYSIIFYQRKNKLKKYLIFSNFTCLCKRHHGQEFSTASIWFKPFQWIPYCELLLLSNLLSPS